MNKNKRPMTSKLQKKMAKEVRTSQGRYPIVETRQYSDELTTKELLKKYPKKKAAKHEEILESAKKGILVKKKIQNKNISRRTTPAVIPAYSTMHVQPEGKRWMKTLVRQNLAERKILAHKGNRIGRKK